MARTRYLADTSVFARLAKPGVAAAFAPLAADGQVGMCAPVAFELGYSARNPKDYRDSGESALVVSVRPGDGPETTVGRWRCKRPLRSTASTGRYPSSMRSSQQ